MKIVFLDAKSVGDASLEGLRLLGELITYELTMPDECTKRITDADIIVTNKVYIGEEQLQHAKKLKLICVAATGVNNIDLEACKKHSIAVCNAAGYSTPSVVQTLFASLFYHYSNIATLDSFVKEGGYAKSPVPTYTGLPFHELSGKRFGVIGFGDIGRHVAIVAESFGAEVVYYSTSGRHNESGYSRVELDELLSTSDFIAINCPLNEQTKNLVNAQNMSQMKKTAYLLNFGRGSIVNEADAADALNRDVFACYITDVYEKEPIAADSILLTVRDKSKLVLTPHVGWASVEARARLIAMICKNIEAFFDGEKNNRVV